MRTVVILPTRNRAALLAGALDSLTAQRGAGRVEIVVADNGSTDETAAVVRRAAGAGAAAVEYLHVAESGKSVALNAAVERAEADVCAFFDDDQVADPYWLASLLAGFERHPDAAAVGGRYDAWPADLGRFWKRALLEPFLVDQGTVERPVRWLAGGNLAVLKGAWRDAGGFDRNYDRGDDAKFCLDLARAGHAVYYVPSAVVFHRLHGDRLTWRGWRRQVRHHAVAMAMLTPAGDEEAAVAAWRRARRRELVRVPYATAIGGLNGLVHQLDWVLRYGGAIRSLRARRESR